MKMYGLEQSCHGHIYRYIFEENDLIAQLKKYHILNEDETIENRFFGGSFACGFSGYCEDIGFPIGGSNSSATFITILDDEKQALTFLKSDPEVDYEDPMLIDLAEGICTIDTTEGIAGQFVTEEEANTVRHDPRYDEAYETIKNLLKCKGGKEPQEKEIVSVFYSAKYKDIRFSNIRELESAFDILSEPPQEETLE